MKERKKEEKLSISIYEYEVVEPSARTEKLYVVQ
jgi:hypothetical protein